MTANRFDHQLNIHIWRIRVPDSVDLLENQMLSTEEKTRLNALTNDTMRRLFLHVHCAKREILASYLNIPAKDLALRQSEYGKPLIAREMGTRLEFNISHTADTAVIAVSPAAPVGIDLEALDRRVNVMALAKRYFDATTVKHLANQAEQQPLFLRYWTQFEAYKKATGLGLRGQDHLLKMTAASKQNDFHPFPDPILKPHWLVAELDTIPGYAVSVVTPNLHQVRPEIQQFDYTPS